MKQGLGRVALACVAVSLLGAASVARAADDEPAVPADNQDLRPRLVALREPDYPMNARSHGLEAKLVFRGVVEPTGVFDSFVLASCEVWKKGAKPDPTLRGQCSSFAVAAQKALGQWLYTPATKDGEPLAVYHTEAVHFRLPGR